MEIAQQKRHHLHIGGEQVPAADGGQFDTTDPATGEIIATLDEATTTDVDNAVETAAEAFETWRTMRPVERSRILHRVSTIIRDRTTELAELESLDQGKPLSQATADVKTAARYFEYYAGLADKLEGTSIPLGSDSIDFTERVPYGVSAQITPWNFPLSLAARGVAPALVAGNTTVVKPAPTTSLTTLALAALCRDAGVPDGVVNVVTGSTEPGAALASHDDVDVITFTGSVSTGRAVMESASTTVTPVTLELGGKNPAIVLPDADLKQATSWISTGIFHNAGQVCSAVDRALVHESVYDEFVDRISTEAASLSLGPGRDDPNMGPLNYREHFESVLEYITIGIEEGATLKTGGSELDRSGYFIEPTVFTAVASDMRIAQEEIFGPVLVVIPFADTDEAIEIANDVKYGLTGGVFSRDITEALTVARAIDAGSISVNEWFGGGVETPFGGMKQSGIGREKGIEGLDTYLQTKNFSINLDS